MKILNYKFQVARLNKLLKALIYSVMVVLPVWTKSPLNYSRFCKVTNHRALQIVCNA